MADAGAQAALRGYRLQALYTLKRILESDENVLFHLEGQEDLDIVTSNGRVLEVIQMKAYGTNITLSTFSPKKEQSFFRRVLKRRKAFPDIKELVVSFGPFGAEIRAACKGPSPERERAISDLVGWGYSTSEAEELLSSLELIEEDEMSLEQSIYGYLEDAIAGMGYDPGAAFDLLHAWLYQASENRERVCRRHITERLIKIGTFLAERAAHHREWFTAIRPLTDYSDEVDQERLSEEFYRGSSARYEHILAGVDIVRHRRLKDIQNAFNRARVVVVRGASGQGKSSLAFRFFKDYAPTSWRFEIRLVQDRTHALSVARALLGHLDAIGAPAYILLDVTPGDLAWPDLVRDLQAHSAARVLVTIREEDWSRTNPQLTNYDFEDIELTFGADEALEIYNKLNERGPSPKALDFDEVWAQFGGQGPLLEFTYLVTQHETLAKRLSQQINVIRDEVRRETGNYHPSELAFLRHVSVASAY